LCSSSSEWCSSLGAWDSAAPGMRYWRRGDTPPPPRRIEWLCPDFEESHPIELFVGQFSMRGIIEASLPEPGGESRSRGKAGRNDVDAVTGDPQSNPDSRARLPHDCVMVHSPPSSRLSNGARSVRNQARSTPSNTFDRDGLVSSKR
jgi:hypothetical protein